MAKKSKLTFRFHYPETPEETEVAINMLIRFAAECVSNKVSQMRLDNDVENNNTTSSAS